MTALTLNENQRRAAEHGHGPMMVLAGPGSGKTTVITYRALHLLRRYQVAPENILVITFSKAAAAQMQRRFTALAGETDIVFGTFHAVFFRILRVRYKYTLEQVLKEDERRATLKHMLVSMGYELEDEFLSAVLNELSLVKNELIDLRYYHSASMGAEEFKILYERYDSYKKEIGKIDFDDMLSLCHALFIGEPDTLAVWQRRFLYIMIDEFQDINRVQYECIKLLADRPSGRHIFIVGDDDQSIYRFRGARPEFLLHFPVDFPDAEQIVLDVNYRSADPIIQFGNRLIAENHIRYGKHIVGTEKKGVPPVMLTADDQNNEAFMIAEIIKKLRKQGRDLNGIAVIFRVNLQARAFIDAFMQANIPYRARDEISIIYEHWIARDLFAYLRLSRERSAGYDPNAERIINKPFRYISKAFLQSAKKANRSIFEMYATDPTLHAQSRNRIEELLFYLQAAGKRTTADAIRYIRQAAGYDTYIREHCQYRKLDPSGLFEVADELQEAAKQFPVVEDYLMHAEETAQAIKQNKKAQADCVTLTTLHSAKGLEFDTVFIAGVAEGIIPHERSKTDAELEEERRLLYVGVTRARDTLYLSMPRTRYDKVMKPSRFMDAKVTHK